MMRVLLLGLALAAPLAAAAAPERYVLDLKATQVHFTWTLGPDTVQGDIPVAGAEVTLDFATPSASTFEVSLDASGARAGFPFATQAMRGPQMLDAGDHPQITFASRHLAQNGDQISAEGEVTIRGIARPMAMTAHFFRPADQAPGDRSHLIVMLEGAVNRHDFGASGWPEMVGPTVAFEIRAVMDRAN